MTHIIRLLYGNDKRNPDRELSLTDLDANIYLQLEGFSPGAGAQRPLFSGPSSRFDGERLLNTSRGNTNVQIMYSLSADNTQYLQVVQRTISRFLLDTAHSNKKVWLEYRWSVSGLDDLPRPVIGQANYYLEVLHADVKQWPNALHSGQMVVGNVEGVALDIVGKPYWEGLEQRAGDADGLANVAGSDTALIYTPDSTLNGSSVAVSCWITHKYAAYDAVEIRIDGSNYLHLYHDAGENKLAADYYRTVGTAYDLTPETYAGAGASVPREASRNGRGYAATFINTEDKTLRYSGAGFDFGDTDFSICGWLNHDTNAVFGDDFYICDSATAGATSCFSVYLDETGVNFYCDSGGGTTTVANGVSGDPQTPDADTWYFFYCYHDATANEIGISVNNNTIVTATHSGGVAAGTSAYFALGHLAAAAGTNDGWDGALDDFAVYDRVLTAAEITAIYTKDIIPNTPISFWSLDENTTADRIDATGTSVSGGTGGSRPLEPSEPYHLALIQIGTSSTVYINGAVHITDNDFLQSNTPGTVSFGCAQEGAYTGYTDALDACRAWFNDIPTAAEILALYTAELPIKTAGETIQSPLYFNTEDGDGAVMNTINAAGIATAFYKFEENALADGNIIYDVMRDNNLTLGGEGSATSATGKVGNCIDITNPFGATANVLNFGDADFSFGCWVNSDDLTTVTTFSGVFGRSGSYGLYYEDTVGFKWEVSSDGATSTIATETTIGAASISTWYFIYCYHDATGNEIGISINNNTADTAAHTTGVYTGGSNDFIIGIGYAVGGTPYYWDGKIDAFGAYSALLTAPQLTQLYNSGDGAEMVGNGQNYGITSGESGDGTSRLRIEIDPPPSETDRVYYAGLLPVDSTFTPANSIYMSLTGTAEYGYPDGGYREASATSGSGSDSATIESALTTPGDLQPGRYRVLAHTRITAGSATTATVTPYFRIGETTSPEQYGTVNSVSSNASFLWQDLGDLEFSWPMDTLIKMTLGLKFAETEATAITAAIDFIMLLPTPAIEATCEDSTITIATGDTLHLDGRRGWVEDASNSDSQLYHFHFEGESLEAIPYKYNYLFVINGEDNQPFAVSNSSTIRVYVTPRWALPGGLAA